MFHLYHIFSNKWTLKKNESFALFALIYSKNVNSNNKSSLKLGIFQVPREEWTKKISFILILVTGQRLMGSSILILPRILKRSVLCFVILSSLAHCRQNLEKNILFVYITNKCIWFFRSAKCSSPRHLKV